MSISCYQIPYEAAAGAANMAIDEAILEWVGSDSEQVVLRTYGWLEPTLSLGYFQSLSAVLAQPGWSDVPLVRRATGGGAIWHDRELTYALVLPAAHPLARRSSRLYETVHESLATSLRFFGLSAHRRRTIEPESHSSAPMKHNRPFLCFTDRDPDDIVASGHKVVGSAQRRRAGAILQHGSLLLERSDRTPELPGVCDLGRRLPDISFWSAMAVDAIGRALEVQPTVSDLPLAVGRRAEELERTIYRAADWTGRR